MNDERWKKLRGEIMELYDMDILVVDGSLAHRYVQAGKDKTPDAVQAAATKAEEIRQKLIGILDWYEATQP